MEYALEYGTYEFGRENVTHNLLAGQLEIILLYSYIYSYVRVCTYIYS